MGETGPVFCQLIRIEREQGNGECLQKSYSGVGLWTLSQEGEMW